MADLEIPAAQNIETFRGDDEPLVLTVRDEDEELVPLTGYKIYLTAKLNRGKTTVNKFQRRNDNAGGNDAEVKIISTGIAHIFIVKANTNDVDTSTKKDYQYDVQVITPASPNLRKTLRSGKLTIFADAGRT